MTAADKKSWRREERKKTHQQALQKPTQGPEPEEANVGSLLSTLPKEYNTLVKIIKVIISQFEAEIETLKEEMNRKDTEMKQLQSEVKDLRNKVTKLETQIDDVQQYERHDTLILSGPSVPPETQP